MPNEDTYILNEEVIKTDEFKEEIKLLKPKNVATMLRYMK